MTITSTQMEVMIQKWKINEDSVLSVLMYCRYHITAVLELESYNRINVLQLLSRTSATQQMAIGRLIHEDRAYSS